jgi:carbon-monoxide dehydrogenase small subunit
VTLHVVVNGRARELEAAPHALLLDVLRDGLELKGAKRSCDTQVCGACTVLVDGLRPVPSRRRSGRDGDGPQGGAGQCGFGTAGMLLTARAMLAENAQPTREDVLHYLRGSLSRCTGYRKIVDAILAAAQPAR